jgi:hypothetical protein
MGMPGKLFTIYLRRDVVELFTDVVLFSAKLVFKSWLTIKRKQSDGNPGGLELKSRD